VPYDGNETYVLTYRNCENQPGITFSSQKADDLLSKLKEEHLTKKFG
jgi:hypothetical protein